MCFIPRGTKGMQKILKEAPYSNSKNKINWNKPKNIILHDFRFNCSKCRANTLLQKIFEQRIEK
jgi:hypothetical protein